MGGWSGFEGRDTIIWDGTIKCKNLMGLYSGGGVLSVPHLMQSDNGDQAIVSDVEEQIIDFDTSVHHFEFEVANNHTFTVLKPGSYLVTFSAIAICANAVPGQKLVIWMKKNGVNVADSATWYTFKSQNLNTVITVTFLYHFEANDTFELWMYGDDTQIKLLATSAVNDVPLTNPAIPACPSIIMTCNYVGND